MKRWLTVAVALAVGMAQGEEGSLSSAGKKKSGWVRLFNGKNLDGWTAKIRGYPAGENFARTFQAEKGVLKVSYEGYGDFGDRFGHLFYKTPFSHYRLRVVYRFVGDQCPGGAGWAWRNSGVMIHSQPPESMGKDQPFPVSVEVQFLGGNGKEERPTANVCTPGTNIVMDGKLVTRHCTNSVSKTYSGDRWVTVEVEVRGNGTIRHIVEGKTVLTYEQPQLDESDPDARNSIRGGEKALKGGYIALQSESHPIEFKKVEILALGE